MKMKNFTFKKLSESDIPLIHTWLGSAHVREFWAEKNLDDFEAFKLKFKDKINSDTVSPYLVLLQGKAIGYIQTYSVDEKTSGIDQFIGVAEFVNKGLGSLFVKEFTDEILSGKKISKVITDPSILNLRAQRAYEKAGFKKTWAMPGEDGDVILMEKKIKKAS
jgi:RimJ/RimL family protein N-acetyltransferase